MVICIVAYTFLSTIDFMPFFKVKTELYTVLPLGYPGCEYKFQR